MEKTLPPTRALQSERRASVFQYFKQLCYENTSGNTTKETIYQTVATKFGYANLNSVKAIIGEFTKKEEKEKQENILIGKGIFETVLYYEDIAGEINAEELNIKYHLTTSKLKDTVDIDLSYNSDFDYLENEVDGMVESREKIYTRSKGFDHFNVRNISEGVARISNFLLELQNNFSKNTKNK